MAISIGNIANSGVLAGASSSTFALNNNKEDVIVLVTIRDEETCGTATATYAGDAMTADISKLQEDSDSANDLRTYIFRKTGAATGSNNVVVSFSEAISHAAVFAVAVGGLDSTGQPDATGSGGENYSSATTIDNTITTVETTTLLFDVVYSKAGGDFTVGSGRTLIGQLNVNGGDDRAIASYRAVSSQSTYTMDWSGGDGSGADDYSQSIVAYSAPTNTAPTVALGTPADVGTVADTTPDLTFTGTDAQSDTVRYHLQLGTATITDQTTNAVYFDGDGDYGQIANFAGIDALTDGTHTVELWAKQDTGSDAYACFASFGDSSWTSRFQTENASSSTGFNFGYSYTGTDADGYKASGGFSNSTWTHLAVVFTNGAVSKVYVNGTEISYNLQNTPTGTPASMDGAKFNIGRLFGSTTNDFKGWIGGFVRVWKTARTGTELNDNKSKHLSDSNLIINLKFLEGSGTTIDNEATSGADMTLTGTSTWATGQDILPFGVLSSVVSGTDSGFSGSPDNTDPFTSGQAVTYTVQSALTDTVTYYWRVRGLDPDGTNGYGAWTANRSFTVSLATEVSSERDAKITGKSTANATRNAKVTGKNTSNAERDAKVTGKNTANASRNAKLTGKATADSSRSAKITGKSTANAERDSKLTGKAIATATRSAKLTGKNTSNAERSAKLTGKNTANDSRSAKVEGTYNLLIDGGIESNYWYNYWSEYNTTGTANHSRDTSVKRSGEASYKIVSTSGSNYDGGRAQGSSENARLGNLVAGEYRFSGWIKTGADVTNAHCVIRERTGFTVVAGGHVTTANQDWTKVEGTFTADGSTDYEVLIGLGSYGSSSAGTAYFDDLLLTPLYSSYRSAKIAGKASATNERDAKVTGKSTANAERDAKLTGKNTADASRSAKVTGKSTANATRSAKVTGKSTANAFRSAKVTGTTVAGTSRSAKIVGKLTANAERDAKITGALGANDSRSAKLAGVATTDNARNAKITGKLTATGERSAKVIGKATSTNNRSAKITGKSTANAERNAKIAGKLTSNAERDAKLSGKNTANAFRSAKLTGSTGIFEASNSRSATIVGTGDIFTGDPQDWYAADPQTPTTPDPQDWQTPDPQTWESGSVPNWKWKW